MRLCEAGVGSKGDKSDQDLKSLLPSPHLPPHHLPACHQSGLQPFSRLERTRSELGCASSGSLASKARASKAGLPLEVRLVSPASFHRSRELTSGRVDRECKPSPDDRGREVRRGASFARSGRRRGELTWTGVAGQGLRDQRIAGCHEERKVSTATVCVGWDCRMGCMGGATECAAARDPGFGRRATLRFGALNVHSASGEYLGRWVDGRDQQWRT